MMPQLIDLPHHNYYLGRPLTAAVPYDPVESEGLIEAFLEGCLKKFESGGLMFVAGDWWCEAWILNLLSVASARLRRRGLSVAIEGRIYAGVAPPPRPPGANVAILLDAPGYASLGEWRKTVAGQVAVLAGATEDFNRIGQPPDFVYHAHGRARERMERLLGPKREQFVKLLKSESRAVRQAVLLNGLGCDLPSWLCPRGKAGKFLAPLLDQSGQELDWFSIDDPWNARMALAVSLIETAGPIIEDLSRLERGHPHEPPRMRIVRQRLTHRVRQRLPIR